MDTLNRIRAQKFYDLVGNWLDNQAEIPAEENDPVRETVAGWLTDMLNEVEEGLGESVREDYGTEWMEAIASALTAKRLTAGLMHTGGGIWCVSVLKTDKGELVWGTSGDKWGADDSDADGGLVGDGNGVWVEVGTDCIDLAAVVDAIYNASVAHGATVRA
jgi:hypothetical protein